MPTLTPTATVSAAVAVPLAPPEFPRATFWPVAGLRSLVLVAGVFAARANPHFGASAKTGGFAGVGARVRGTGGQPDAGMQKGRRRWRRTVPDNNQLDRSTVRNAIARYGFRSVKQDGAIRLSQSGSGWRSSDHRRSCGGNSDVCVHPEPQLDGANGLASAPATLGVTLNQAASPPEATLHTD